ncbi:MAG TPA: hypothetical protein VEG44_01865 [Candidatus Acidoferrales bacterium]|nr:hypothetical protein [Candidatus Acidoferrales bacterium]
MKKLLWGSSVNAKKRGNKVGSLCSPFEQPVIYNVEQLVICNADHPAAMRRVKYKP